MWKQINSYIIKYTKTGSFKLSSESSINISSAGVKIQRVNHNLIFFIKNAAMRDWGFSNAFSLAVTRLWGFYLNKKAVLASQKWKLNECECFRLIKLPMLSTFSCMQLWAFNHNSIKPSRMDFPLCPSLHSQERIDRTTVSPASAPTSSAFILS